MSFTVKRTTAFFEGYGGIVRSTAKGKVNRASYAAGCCGISCVPINYETPSKGEGESSRPRPGIALRGFGRPGCYKTVVNFGVGGRWAYVVFTWGCATVELHVNDPLNSRP
jgi:hypothetical protein